MKKTQPIKPDEIVDCGFFKAARYGKFIFMQNAMDDLSHKKFIQQAAKRYPVICERINDRVSKICELIDTFDPLLLMQCSYFNFMMAHKGVKSEIEIDKQRALSLRMLDYIQSLIVSLSPSNVKENAFDQNRYDELKNEVDELYSDLNLNYHIAHSAHSQINDPNFDADYYGFYVDAQLLWVNVRCHRYSYYDIAHLKEMLMPHNDVFTEMFDITITDLIEGLERLEYSLTRGLIEVTKELDDFRNRSLEAIEQKILNGDSDKEPPILMQEVVKENGWQDWQDSIMGRFIKFDLFDLEKVTGLPEKLLKELSWNPGQYEGLLATGDFSGWPLRLQPIQIRPFLKIDGRYYCFELANLMDNFYRVIQRLLTRLRPDYKVIWNDRQKNISEDLPFLLFEKILPNAEMYRAVYHQWPTGRLGELQWCETDGLIIFDDHLIIVEVKAGAFTYTPPATDFDSYVQSIKDLLLKPSLQAKRFNDYLKSKEQILIYDCNHNPLTSLKLSQFRHITACCVTIDNFTTFAAQAENLKPLGTDTKEFPIWSISIDDLRVYSDIFDSPTVFTHFLEERKRAFQSPALSVNDELDHMCLYLKHNRYVTYAEDFYESEPVTWNGYRQDLDNYFSDLKSSPDSAIKPFQPLPQRIREILNCLESKRAIGHCKAASYLLDLDGATRDSFDSGIEEVLSKQQVKKYLIPFSTFGDVKITVFCETNGINTRDDLWKREYVLATLLRLNESERLLLNISIDNKHRIESADFAFLTKDDIQGHRYKDVLIRSEKQRTNFIQMHMRDSHKNKIGRNEKCPCGSGIKYKKCCGNKA